MTQSSRTHRPYVYHFRLAATVALAEISRPVGTRLRAPRGPRVRPPAYDRALEGLATDAGEVLSLWDLGAY